MKTKLSILTLLCFSSLLANAHNPDGKVNYPSNYQVAGGVNLFIFGDYLFWSASESGLYFAQTGLGSTGFDGKIKRIPTHWGNGARAGLGLNFPKAGYDLAAIWTWFATNAHASAHNLIPLWAVPPGVPFAATHATGKWNLNLNVGDLEWGRSSWFGGFFSLRPFFSLRGVWMEQSLQQNVQYTTLLSGKLHSDSDLRGGGLRAGCDVRFALPYGFGIYGLASGSLLFGRIDADFRLKENGTIIAKTKDHFWKGLSSLQLGVGASWDTHFWQDRLHFEMHVGWEQNIWFSLNQMNHFMSQITQAYYFKENGNLCTQGLIAGGRFSF